MQLAARPLVRRATYLPRRVVCGAAQQGLFRMHQLSAADGAVSHQAAAAAGNLQAQR